MHDLRSKLKRQIEIIGLVTDNPGRFTFGRLADYFHVDDETIKTLRISVLWELQSIRYAIKELD